ncbi:MAG: MATE family efflux transporter [Coprococcus sp.]
MNKSYEIDMCHGPLLGKILLFSIPLMLSGILQLLFNAADTIVVGRFAGSTALAAVGSTGSLINLLVNLFIGLSVGANVLVARFHGAGRDDEVSETIHTAISLSILSGIFLLILGITITKTILIWMGTPGDVLDQASLYLKIYFLGMPMMLLYNFGSSILRAIGDTRRPLYYLVAAGIVNVVLNVIFVVGFHMGVAGVAIATVVSQTISASLIIRCLTRMEGCCHLDIRKLHMGRKKIQQILQIGLPAGMQGVVFSLSNVLIQSSVNSFGSTAMAGNTAAMNIESFVYMSMNTFQQTTMSFTSQNYGAGEEKRIHRVLFICLGLVVAVGLAMGISAWLAGDFLLSVYSSESEVVAYGLRRMSVICTTYFLCGIMDTVVGALRGIGYSLMPMIVSLIGACGLRIIWIFTIFQWHRSLWMLYISYPVTWFVTAVTHIICYILVRRKQLQKNY